MSQPDLAKTQPLLTTERRREPAAAHETYAAKSLAANHAIAVIGLVAAARGKMVGAALSNAAG